jgi:UrcA family protein
MFRKSLVSAAIVLASIAAVPASAAETEARAVPYGDLNLARPKGVASLRSRIARAVDEVCGDPYLVGVKVQQAIRKCRTATQTDANNQLALLLETRERMAAHTGGRIRVAS